MAVRRKAGMAGLALAALLSAGAAQADSQLLKNFTLIDGRGGPAVPGSSMLVSDGRILWVGPAGEAPAAGDAEVIDLAGKYVIPGLIDLHIHLGNVHDLVQNEQYYTRANVEKDLATYAAYGITSVAIMGTDKDSIFQIRKEQRAGRPDEARLYTAGQGIVFKGGYGGVPGINIPVSTPKEAVAVVDAQAAKGADFIKLWLDDELHTMPKMPPEISKATIDAAHRNGLKAFAHIFYLEDAKRLVAEGIDGFVHSVRDKPVDAELVNAMRAANTVQMGATLSREASLFTYAGKAPQFGDPFFKQSLSPEALKQLSGSERQQTLRKNPHFGELPGFFEAATRNFKTLVDGGVRVGLGTDSGPPGRFAGYSAHWELELMVAAGIPADKALLSATGDAADILGAKDIGTLERAKWADFVVLDANPLENILNTRRVSAVYIAGQKVPSVKQ